MDQKVTPITDDALAELEEMHLWRNESEKAAWRWAKSSGICYPPLRQRLAEAEAYRDEVEAAKPTVQALLDSGERAASEAADLRQRLTAAEARLAEAERERVAEARKDGERLDWLLFDHGFRVGYNFEDRASIDSSMRGTR